MTENIKPQHYLVRPGGKAVPLIALDELPQHIRVEGVIKSTTDLKELIHMTCVGEVPPRHLTYQITDINQRAFPSQYRSPFPINHNTPVASPQLQPLNTSPKYNKHVTDTASTTPAIAKADLFPGPPKYFGISEHAPAADTSTTQTPTTPDAFIKHDPLPAWKNTSELGGRLPTPGKKIYCSHWMSTGECDYAQQGCLYKHEMPLDVTLLNTLGYQDIPKWYREKHGIGKLTAVPGSGAHIRGSSVPSAPTGSWRQKPATTPSKNQRGPRTGRQAFPLKGRQPRDLLDAEDLHDHRSPRGRGLLDSHWAPITPSRSSEMPYPRSAPAARDVYQSVATGSEADLSTSAKSESDASLTSIERPVSTPYKSRAINHQQSNNKRKGTTKANTRPGLTTSTGATGRNSKSAKTSPYHERSRRVPESRRTSVASDYEAILANEQEKRDKREAEEYAITAARYKSQQEQARLNRMQEEAIAAAKRDFEDRGRS